MCMQLTFDDKSKPMNLCKGMRIRDLARSNQTNSAYLPAPSVTKYLSRLRVGSTS